MARKCKVPRDRPRTTGTEGWMLKVERWALWEAGVGGKRSNTLVPGVRRSTRPHKGATRDVSLVRHVVGEEWACVWRAIQECADGKEVERVFKEEGVSRSEASNLLSSVCQAIPCWWLCDNQGEPRSDPEWYLYKSHYLLPHSVNHTINFWRFIFQPCVLCWVSAFSRSLVYFFLSKNKKKKNSWW